MLTKGERHQITLAGAVRRACDDNFLCSPNDSSGGLVKQSVKYVIQDGLNFSASLFRPHSICSKKSSKRRKAINSALKVSGQVLINLANARFA